MAEKLGEIRDVRAIDRLYRVAEEQGGYLTANQAIEAGVPRSTLGYHARDAGSLERVGSGVYKLINFPEAPHGHVIAAWLGLSRADAVVSHVSALELMEITDLIADEVHVTLPRSKRGITVPVGVRAHFTARPIEKGDRRQVKGIPVTGIERTIADMLRTSGWTEQIDLAIRQAIDRGQTTLPRLRDELPKNVKRRLNAIAEAGLK
ncbi:MAG: type IV toxin-antitoxin system AbiEi family antitoxin domain-containing protein [Solirubrobacterales bacterium]|nr:type IV toxin-antitoxin system AbiEi family antitoxin domain-containing protein [Solirubrobacterales bacterium]